jgi:hypothetical protein
MASMQSERDLDTELFQGASDQLASIRASCSGHRCLLWCARFDGATIRNGCYRFVLSRQAVATLAQTSRERSSPRLRRGLVVDNYIGTLLSGAVKTKPADPPE